MLTSASLLLLAGLFLLAAAMIVLAGSRLARYGDALGVHTGLGGLWIGSILLAGATSLPELATDISAVRIGAPNLAAGDLFGSSMSNMLILAALDLLPPRYTLLRSAALDHAMSATLAMVLTALAAAFVLFRGSVTVLGLGPGSVLIAAMYVVGTRAIYRHNEAQRSTEGVIAEALDTGHSDPVPSMRKAVIGFIAASLVILLVAPFFARIAEALAQRSGLGSTFVGTWLVGMSTSLPELVASLAAVRMRAYDLAVGNLFGSNALNMIMFVLLDAVTPTGSFFSTVSPTHALSALMGIALMATGLGAIVFRARGRFKLLEPSSAVMVVLYVLGLGMIYVRSAGS